MPLISRLYVVLAIGNLLDAIVLSFLPVYGASIGLTPTQLGTISAMALAAWCLSPTIGTWIDASTPFRVLRLSALLRVLLLASACAYTFYNGGSGIVLGAWLTLTFGIGVVDMISDLSTQTAASILVPEDRVSHVYGRISAIQSFTGAVLAPFIAGALVKWPLERTFITLTILSVVILPIRMRSPRPTFEVQETPIYSDTFLRNIREGLEVIVKDSWLRRTAITVGSLNICSSAIGTAFVVHMIQGHNVDPAKLGAMLSLSAFAIPIGGVLAGQISDRLGFSRSIVIGILALLVSLGAPMAGPSLWILGFIYFLTGLLTPLVGVNIISHRQLVVGASVIGRVNGVFQFIGIGLAPAGALVGGLLTELLGTYPVFLGVVSFCLLVCIVCRPWEVNIK